jgi:hypothetical protein
LNTNHYFILSITWNFLFFEKGLLSIIETLSPVLKKVIKVRKKYNAHDENNKFKTGDKVSIIESKPFSKNKKFQVMESSK